jgi:hypothetical protein
MKRTITTTFCILLIALCNIKSNAQSGWIDSGAVWHQGFWEFNFGNPVGYIKNWYDRDTIISGKLMQIVLSEKQTKTTYPDGSVNITDTLSSNDFTFYTSNDTVYLFLPNGQLQFMWHNNPNIGDVWDFGMQYDSWTNTYIHAYAKVDTVFYVTINGIQLKEFTVYSCKNIQGDEVNFSTDTSLFINHLFGNINSKFGPTTGFNDIGTFTSNQIISEHISDVLNCFQSNSFSFHQFYNNDCFNNIFSHIQEQTISDNIISLYPNPTTEKLNIRNTQNIISYQVNLLNGACVDRGSSFPINTAQLENGIYFLNLTDKYHQQTNYKFIKN